MPEHLGRGFGRLRELEPIDFESREWVPHSGWPFDKEHLKPFYERGRRLFEFSWPSNDPEGVWDEELHTGPFVTGSDVLTRTFAFGNPAVFPRAMSRSIKNSAHVLALTSPVAVELRVDGSPSSVSSLVVRTAKDHEFQVRATTYVLAAGGIENARLLLASHDRQPDGLGNGHSWGGTSWNTLTMRPDDSCPRVPMRSRI